MSTIQKRVTAIALADLSAHGFERDNQRVACNEFTKRFQETFERLCRPFVTHFEGQIAATEEQEKLNRFSWAVNELVQLWRMAAPRFVDRIVRLETLDHGPGKIRCETATMHLDALGRAWEDSIAVRMAELRIPPQSEKARRRRRRRFAPMRHWLPYPFAA